MTEKDTHAAGTPRWVKVFGIVGLVLVVLVVVILITGRGGHGPGRHAPAGDTSEGHSAPPPGLTHRQP